MQRHVEHYEPALGGTDTRSYQRGLFDAPEKPFVDDAPSRRSDPPTSRLAAAQVVSSGRASARNDKILAFLRAHDAGYTYREIGAAIEEDPTEVMRRLNTLRQKSLVEKYGCRKCSVNGNEMTTWRAKR